MPCWNTRTTRLEMAKANAGVMAKAFIAAGIPDARLVKGSGMAQDWVLGRHPQLGEVRFVNGRVEVYRSSAEATALTETIRTKYTEAAFEQTATRYGYQVSRNDRGQLVAERMTYER